MGGLLLRRVWRCLSVPLLITFTKHPYSAEHKQRDAYDAIARALHARGIGGLEPTQFSLEELVKYFGPLETIYGGIPITYILGTNARCKGDRARALGWKPTHTNEDFLSSIEPEVEYVLKKQSEKA
ncbi:hypothetical protein M422DRAFT_263601 [Sphaerobolus stellatus SS14]|uniref:NAD(P)-binding domain-containing protein n=1 Tax=Sphaerobolus stellatus (strain SS14) TaxID=990650 RepID=A0A0C9VAC0_SPHS4|nr:hypothetical protein M422DRAFT_263601 [Sphaerobolus stellatus SS14]